MDPAETNEGHPAEAEWPSSLPDPH
jgi:hypothetical protein